MTYISFCRSQLCYRIIYSMAKLFPVSRVQKKPAGLEGENLFFILLSLYSTAMQNLSRWLRPPMRRFRVTYSIPTCWYLKSLMDLTQIPTVPMQIPTDPTRAQREQVEYRSCWVPSRWGLHWPCTFHVVCAAFSAFGTRKLPNANAVSGGIQALVFVDWYI